MADMEPVVASARVNEPPRAMHTDETARTAEQLAALRHATPSRLKRQLTGDLDNILQKALLPAPGDRYATAQDLSDELRRHAEGMPLAARPRSLRYRAAKFVGRHKAAAALMLVLDLVLVGSVVMVAGQARRIARERDRAQELSGVLQGLLRYADPTTGQRDSLALVAALRDATARARDGVARDPELWGRTLVVLGSVYRNRGQPDSAAALWREAVAALEPAVASDHPVLLEALGWLGTVQVEQGDMPGGVAVLERALAHARRLDATRRAELSKSLIDLGYGRQVSGDEAGARTLYREAVAILETLPDSGADPESVGDYERAHVNLGFLALRRGDLADAEASFRLAYQRRLARLGEDSGPTLNAMTALARALLRLERVEEAAALSSRALETRRRLHPEPHLNLAESLELHAQVLAAEGNAAPAESLAREALATYRAASGPRSLFTAYAVAGLGTVLARQERHAESAAARREALALYRELAGEQHPATLLAAVSLAETEYRLNRAAIAEPLLRQTVPRMDSLWPDAPVLAQPLALLGEVLSRSGRCGEAAPYLRRAAELAHTQWPAAHRSVAEPRRLLQACR
jgi:serine/threonine-protein kinase